MASQYSAIIWNYFDISQEDKTKAICTKCLKGISHGGKDSNRFGHSRMKKHLATHTALHSEFTKKQEEYMTQKTTKQETDSHVTQATLEQSLVKVWDINHSSSQAIINKIGEFICVDQQPLSVVEYDGFLKLIKH